jgi:ankyrin repeat protein
MVSSTNVFGKTIFHVSAERGSLEGLLVIVQSLKNICDDREELIQFLVNRLNEYEPNKGYSALLLAVHFGHSRMVKYLALSNEVNVNLRVNTTGDTALHLAIQRNAQEIREILVKHGKADVNMKNAKNERCQKVAQGHCIQLIASPVKKSMSLGSQPLSSIRKKASEIFI